ncbi:hypothetical protein ACSSS7_003922 [Eimeria intestinalis]
MGRGRETRRDPLRMHVCVYYYCVLQLIVLLFWREITDEEALRIRMQGSSSKTQQQQQQQPPSGIEVAAGAEGAFQNASTPLDRSVCLDLIPTSLVGRWAALQSLATLMWSVSALFGGFLADYTDYRQIFIFTGRIYIVAQLVYLPCLWLLPHTRGKQQKRSAETPPLVLLLLLLLLLFLPLAVAAIAAAAGSALMPTTAKQLPSLPHASLSAFSRRQQQQQQQQ